MAHIILFLAVVIVATIAELFADKGRLGVQFVELGDAHTVTASCRPVLRLASSIPSFVPTVGSTIWVVNSRQVLVSAVPLARCLLTGLRALRQAAPAQLVIDLLFEFAQFFLGRAGYVVVAAVQTDLVSADEVLLLEHFFHDFCLVLRHRDVPCNASDQFLVLLAPLLDYLALQGPNPFRFLLLDEVGDHVDLVLFKLPLHLLRVLVYHVHQLHLGLLYFLLALAQLIENLAMRYALLPVGPRSVSGAALDGLGRGEEQLGHEDFVLQQKSLIDDIMRDLGNLHRHVRLHETELLLRPVVDLGDLARHSFQVSLPLVIQFALQVLLVENLQNLFVFVGQPQLEVVYLLLGGLDLFHHVFDFFRKVLDAVVEFCANVAELLVDLDQDWLLLLEAVVLQAIGAHFELDHSVVEQFDFFGEERLHRQALLLERVHLLEAHLFLLILQERALRRLLKPDEALQHILVRGLVDALTARDPFDFLVVLLALPLDDEEQVVDVGGEHFRDVGLTHVLLAILDEELFQQSKRYVFVPAEDTTVQQVRLLFDLET